jgi:transcriptional regulator with XRE-family HTH domain
MATTLTSKHIPVLVQDALLSLGRRVALTRKQHQHSQADLARLAGVGLSTVVSIEGGHDGVSAGNLFKVLDALGALEQTTLLLNPAGQRAELVRLLQQESHNAQDTA